MSGTAEVCFMLDRNFCVAYRVEQISTGIIIRIGEEFTGPRTSKLNGMVGQEPA